MRDLTADEIAASAEALGLVIAPDEAVEVAHCVNALRDALARWDETDLSAVDMRVPFFQIGGAGDG